MRIKRCLEIKAYRFLNTPAGRHILNFLSNFIYVKGLNKEKNFPGFVGQYITENFFVIITVDAESGYVGKDEFRVWQKQAPKAYMGFYKGIENWRGLFNKYDIKATFFLSTNCFSAEGTEYKKIIRQLKLLVKEGHEIGMHIHPDSDLALQKILNKRFYATSAKFFSKEEINQIASKSKYLIKKNLGIDVTSFRWGNWALNTDAVDILEKNAIRIDSSATPGISGHKNDEREYDWSRTKNHYPWLLSKKDYQNTNHQNSKILEIPIATFSLFGKTFRADPVYLALLNACFDCYHKYTDRAKTPFGFVVITHSNESTHKDGTPTKVVKAMEDFIRHAGKKNIEFISLKKFCSKHYQDS